MVYLYSGILLINKTVWTTNTLNNIGESHKYYTMQKETRHQNMRDVCSIHVNLWNRQN